MCISSHHTLVYIPPLSPFSFSFLPSSRTFLSYERPFSFLDNRCTGPPLPSSKVRTLRRLQIKLGLSLRRVLRQRARRTRLLCRRIRVERIAQTRGQIGGCERGLIGEDAFAAEEGVGPVGAVDVGAVGDGGLREGAGCDGRRAVVAGAASEFCFPRWKNEGAREKVRTHAVFLKVLTMA